MSEAVTLPSLTMMTSTVSEESLARDTHTHTHTHSLGSTLNLKFALQTKRRQLAVILSTIPSRMSLTCEHSSTCPSCKQDKRHILSVLPLHLSLLQATHMSYTISLTTAPVPPAGNTHVIHYQSYHCTCPSCRQHTCYTLLASNHACHTLSVLPLHVSFFLCFIA